MSKYSYFNLIKSQAKKLAQEQGLQLSVAQERLATSLKFKDFHELTTVAFRNPYDARLIRAALGSSDPADAIYGSPVYERFCEEIDNLLSGEAADTNAYDYSCEDFEVTSSSYDETKAYWYWRFRLLTRVSRIKIVHTLVVNFIWTLKLRWCGALVSGYSKRAG